MTFFVQLPTASYVEQLPGGFDQTSGYSEATAQALMWLSQLVYEPGKYTPMFQRWGLTPLATLRSESSAKSATYGFICSTPHAAFLIFAGTDPGRLKTVLTDADTLPNDAGLHPGFVAALEAVWKQVPALPSGRLYVAGHSLGAALAVLAAHRLATERHTIVDGVYTFGLPRVGGTDFANDYEARLGSRTYRLVNGDDPVPAVPFAELGFVHVGRRISCPHGGSFAAMPHLPAASDNEPGLARVETSNAGHMIGELLRGRWDLAQPGLLGFLYSVLPGGLADHMQARYLRALRTPVR